MHPFSEYASFILDRMEPDRRYEPQDLRAFVPDTSIEQLREIMGGGTSPGNGTIATFFPNATFLRGVWAGGMSWIYPTGNYYPASMSEVGFVDLAGGDYHLAPSSPYRNAALDGTDVGANIDTILAATAGVK